MRVDDEAFKSLGHAVTEDVPGLLEHQLRGEDIGFDPEEVLAGICSGTNPLYDINTKQWNRWPNTSVPSSFESSTSVETKLAEYFNTLADAASPYTTKLGNERRIWSGRYAREFIDARLRGLHKPGLVVLDPQLALRGSRRARWHDLYIILELGSDMLSRREVYAKLAEYARLMFKELNRRFILSFALMGTKMVLLVFDRTGLLVSEQFDVHAEPGKLIRVAVGILYADHLCIGGDPAVRLVKTGRGYERYITVNGLEYKVIQVIHLEHVIVCRGTVCTLVERNGAEFVIKDSWVETTKTVKEHQRLHRVNGIDGVVQLEAYEQVYVNGVPDTTMTARRLLDEMPGSWQWLQNYETISRDHYRLVMKPTGDPLKDFNSLEELVYIFIDIVRGESCRRLYVLPLRYSYCVSLSALRNLKEKDIMHGDISEGNIILAKDGLNRRRGVLIDFECSAKVGNFDEYEQIVRTLRTSFRTTYSIQVLHRERCRSQLWESCATVDCTATHTTWNLYITYSFGCAPATLGQEM